MQDTKSVLPWSMSLQIFLYVILPGVLAVLGWFLVLDADKVTCYTDLSDNGASVCQPKCSKGHFGLPYMQECLPWLTCREIQSSDFHVLQSIGNGAVKMVYLAEWKGYQMVLNSLINPAYKDDFQHGLNMLISLQKSQHVTQLVGHCKNTYVTQYHELGSADQILELLKTDFLSDYEGLELRLNLCINYVEIINFLHNSPIGTRVMCDSNDLQKTLHQYLVKNDLTLMANDLDALPEVNHTAGRYIKCGHRVIRGDFVAPEQHWPYDNKEYDDKLMPLYDEKTDIWKIPDVCDHFLEGIQGSDAVRFHLFKIHKDCKEEDPSLRPNAQTVLEEYLRVRDEMGL